MRHPLQGYPTDVKTVDLGYCVPKGLVGEMNQLPMEAYLSGNY